uniref:Psilocybin cluster transcription regulator n=1 Tax=Psilocybe cyanescens TaxID=93625 RepID=PSIR_PSICY|nr:RecName: Full=Psilocybin cluster transcription regulator [Psilocybe cyanescens]ASU62247.1 putative transcriptional regulator [Psilocybe cyanescens]
MAPTTPATHDPALSHGAPPTQGSQAPANAAPNLTPADISGMQLNGLDQSQIMNLLRSLPGMFTGAKIPDQGQGNPKEDAAQTLSNLAQASSPFGGQHLPIHYQTGAAGGLPGINDPGPSTHPRGPPNLGQLSAVAMQAAPATIQHQDQQQSGRQEDGEQAGNTSIDSPSAKDGENGTGEFNQTSTSTPSGGRRGGRSATMGSDEWSRQRKDNHKEVERRRRGNINEGINELGRIVPSGSGEKAKGAILSRAVQYIHHLKENEARNIEKWTLEKLLMDQAMGDLQAQLEEIKRLWEEERMARTRLEAELEVLRNMNGVSTAGAGSGAAKDESAAGTKRRSTDGADAAGTNVEGGNNDNAEGERDGKRQRTE